MPPLSFFKEFDIPRSVRKEVFFDAADSRQTLRDMFGDVRMLVLRRRVDEPLRAVDVAASARSAVARPAIAANRIASSPDPCPARLATAADGLARE